MSNINMMIRKSINSIFILLATVLVNPLYALEFECSSGNYNRFIRQELPGITHLCEVTVTDVENERRVMWYANHDTLFCSKKTLELKAKYEKEWGFKCDQWPDHDGVDQLSNRHRTILDAELKKLIERGERQDVPFVVEGLKAAASRSNNANDTDPDVNTLVVQFFLHEPETGNTSDVTHVIRDDGLMWNTHSTIDSLATHIKSDGDYTVDSALISNVTDTGALEIITTLVAENNASPNQGCYGNQTLATQNNGQLIARTPHRFICAEASR